MSPVYHGRAGFHAAEGFEPTTATWTSHGCVVLASTFIGLLILAGYIVSRKSNQRQLFNSSHRVVAQVVAQQRLWALDRSRGVSRIASSMPTKHSPQDPPSGDEDGFNAPKAISQDTTIFSSMDDTSRGTRNATDAPTQSWTMQNRPRPPPPLTPPALSGGPLGFEGISSQFGHSSVVDFDKNFFGLPNPDYMSATSDSDSATSSFRTPSDKAGTPRRRSYTKVLPFVPEQDRHGSPNEAIAITQHHRSVSSLDPRNDVLDNHEVNIQGEIISVLDDAGAGWKRHTRVYGGGICLACLESEGKEGGGFYGANVRPEDRRH